MAGRKAEAVCAAALAIVLQLSSPARGQPCPGDIDRNGNVSVDELVLSVRSSLGQCMPLQCMLDFNSNTDAHDKPLCVDHGVSVDDSDEPTCTRSVHASFISNGENIVFFLYEFKLVIAAQVVNGGKATIFGWGTNLEDPLEDLDGTVILAEDHGTIAVSVQEPKFAVHGCPFRFFAGNFVSLDDGGGIPAVAGMSFATMHRKSDTQGKSAEIVDIGPER